MKTRKLMQGKLQMVAIIAVSVMFGMLVSACGTAKKSAKVGTEAQTEANLNEVYEDVEQMPEFPGGIPAMQEFLGRTMKYPEEARKKGIQGRVIIQFVVGKDGRISKARVIQGVESSLDQEALRIISNMPKWKPGKLKDGTKVNVKFTIPIMFRL